MNILVRVVLVLSLSVSTCSLTSCRRHRRGGGLSPQWMTPYLIAPPSCNGANKLLADYVLTSSTKMCLKMYSSSNNMEDTAILPEEFLDSPLSQLPPDDYESGPPPGLFARDKQWLESATELVFDEVEYPMGELTPEEVETIVGLMSAWVRRRSVNAALTVERLLKRVVDDIREGNFDILVSTRMYTIAIDAWAKSGAREGALRAQHIHDTMVETYLETQNLAILPSTISYNTLMNAWGKSGHPNAPQMAERVLEELIESDLEFLKPDAVTFSTILDTYARSDYANATLRAEELFQMMDSLGIKRNVYTFSALQNVYARSGSPDGPGKALSVLQRMQRLYESGDVFAKPNCVNYNAVLNALSRQSNYTSAKLAHEILGKMEMPPSEGGFDVEPDRLSYALAILTCARCQDEVFAAETAEKNLLKLEARAKLEAERREAVSSAAPPSVTLDIECFNVALTALSKGRVPKAADRTLAVLQRMEAYADEGHEHVRPNTRSWNAVLNALSRSKHRGSAQRAEEVLNHMHDLHQSGFVKAKPDAFSFAAVLSAYQKSSESTAASRAHEIVTRMEELYMDGEIDVMPDVYHFTILCDTWARSKQPIAATRALDILGQMLQLHQEGFANVKPNVRTFNAALDCLASGGMEDEAEQLLYHMISVSEEGDRAARPDSFSFNSVIQAILRARRPGCGRRAEAILELFLEYADANPGIRLESRCFNRLIMYYGRTRLPDSPYRAEYILNRMIALFKAGHKNVEPNAYAFKTVMDAYTYAKHPDAGETAERLLITMRKLGAEHGASRVKVDASVLNSLMNAWAASGSEDAGRRAEIHLDSMERQYAAGETDMKPETRSYGRVLKAWSISSCFDKANRALGILRRMEAQRAAGNENVRLHEHCYSLVINVCAFTNSGIEAETEAFEIAVKILDEMLESRYYRPSSLTYGWFIQACGRLRVPDKRIDHAVRAWKLCCKEGLATDFVLNRFAAAVPDKIFNDTVGPVLANADRYCDERERFKFRVTMADLPDEWSRKYGRSRNREVGDGDFVSS